MSVWPKNEPERIAETGDLHLAPSARLPSPAYTCRD